MADPPAPAQGNSEYVKSEVLKFLTNMCAYHGEEEDLYRFISDIDHVIPHFNLFDAFTQGMIGRNIRNKLKGRAQQVLLIHQNLNSWADIKSMLINKFGNPKTIEQIDLELRECMYKNNITEYYEKIEKLTSELNQKCRLELRAGECQRNINCALKKFITGLPSNLCVILQAREPDTIYEAYQILVHLGYLENNSSSQYNTKRFKPNQNHFHTGYNNNRNNFQNNNFQNKNNNYRNPNINQNYNNNHYPRPNYNPNPFNNNYNNVPSGQQTRNINRNFNYQQNRNPVQRNQAESMDVDPTSSQVRRNQFHVEHVENFPLIASTENYRI